MTLVRSLAGSKDPALRTVMRQDLRGVVQASDGSPIVGAVVTLVDVDARAGTRASRETTTDATGAFTLGDATLPARVQVVARGFAPGHVTVTTTPVTIVLVPAALTESVIVTADRPPAWRDPIAGATVFGAEDLERLPALTLDEALRSVSGFSLFRRSPARAANPTTHGVTMRGLSASGASRGLVLLDGVPLNDGFGGWVTWTRLPSNAIERVDLERGGSSDAYGSDALGGVLRVSTPVARRHEATFGAGFGSPGVGSASVSGGASVTDSVSAFGATSWFRTDGDIPVEPESRGPVDQSTDADWINGFGRVDVVRPGRRVTFTGWGGRDDRGNGTVIQRNRMSGGTFGVAYEAVGGATSFAARVSVSPNSFDQTFSFVAPGRATETLTSTQRIETDTRRLIVEAGHSRARVFLLGRAALTNASASFHDVNSSGTTDLDLRDRSEAVSITAGVTAWPDVTLTGGVRHEWRAAPTSADGRDGATVARAHAAWRASERVTVRGGGGTSHRWPTLNELVRGFRVGAIVTQANPDLKPERGRSIEGGVTVDGTRWQVSGAVFHTVVADAIANVTIGTNLRQRQNAGDVHARGVELDAELRPRTWLRVRASSMFTDATFRDSLEPAIEGLGVPQVPRASGSISGDVLLPRDVVVSALWQSVGAQFDDDLNRFRLAPGHHLEARVAGRLRHFGWHIVFENVLDSRIEVGRTPLVTLAPGRAVRVGVQWRLGR